MVKRILIGDDDEEYLTSLARVLKEPGVKVDTAITPERVVELARNTRYDKIVTDLDYTEGGGEGYQVLKEIRELAPVRILFTAKAGDERVREKAEQNGATYVISKYNLQLLKELLKRGKI